MADVTSVLNELKEMYGQYTGQPAPEIPPDAYVTFPAGVDPIEYAAREVGYLKNLTEQIRTAEAHISWTPRMDTFLARDAYVVRIEIPGVRREDLKVLTSGTECVVRGDHRPPNLPEGLRPLHLESQYGSLERRFPLPPHCRTDRITARCSEGVLEVRLPFDAQVAPAETKVDIS